MFTPIMPNYKRGTPAIIVVLWEFPYPFRHTFGRPFGCTEEYVLKSMY